MDNVNFIVTAKHYSLRYGADGSVRGFLKRWQEKLHKERGVVVNIKGIEQPGRGAPVRAYIHQGQWLAECECGGHEFVDPQDPVFFCWSCVNRANDSYLRPVEFPAEWQLIEAAILARPVNDIKGATDLERAGLAQPAIVIKSSQGEFPLVRSWKPEESLDELLKQNAVVAHAAVEPGKIVMVEVLDGV